MGRTRCPTRVRVPCHRSLGPSTLTAPVTVAPLSVPPGRTFTPPVITIGLHLVGEVPSFTPRRSRGSRLCRGPSWRGNSLTGMAHGSGQGRADMAPGVQTARTSASSTRPAENTSWPLPGRKPSSFNPAAGQGRYPCLCEHDRCVGARHCSTLSLQRRIVRWCGSDGRDGTARLRMPSAPRLGGLRPRPMRETGKRTASTDGAYGTFA